MSFTVAEVDKTGKKEVKLILFVSVIKTIFVEYPLTIQSNELTINLRNVQSGSKALPASCTTATVFFSPEVKAAMVWR